jgi:hypothetical protein
MCARGTFEAITMKRVRSYSFRDRFGRRLLPDRRANPRSRGTRDRRSGTDRREWIERRSGLDRRQKDGHFSGTDRRKRFERRKGIDRREFFIASEELFEEE